MATEDILGLIPNTADGVVAVDREQRILLWNEAANALLGFTAEEVLSRLCCEVFGGRDGSGRLVCHRGCLGMRMALRQELVPTRDLLVRTKAGREVWLSVSSVVVPARRRQQCLLVHLFRDVTREKDLEQGVQQLLSSAAKLALSRGAALPSRGTDSPMSLPPSPPSMDLSPREREVLSLLASGTSTKAIARKLSISLPTVRNHIHGILAKLGVHSQLQAVVLSLKKGLIRGGAAAVDSPDRQVDQKDQNKQTDH